MYHETTRQPMWKSRGQIDILKTCDFYIFIETVYSNELRNLNYCTIALQIYLTRLSKFDSKGFSIYRNKFFINLRQRNIHFIQCEAGLKKNTHFYFMYILSIKKVISWYRCTAHMIFFRNYSFVWTNFFKICIACKQALNFII